jgi:hypothetical protein
MVTVAEPLHPPKQETLVEAEMEAVPPAAETTVTVAVMVQPLASLMYTV